MANVEIVLASLPQNDVKNWPELRYQNRLDFEKNLQPLNEDLARWRSLSARGKQYTPRERTTLV